MFSLKKIVIWCENKFLLISLCFAAAPEWAETINNTQIDIGSEHTMRCVASGKPFPFIRWYKDGYMVNRKGKKQKAQAVCLFIFLYVLYVPCILFQYGKGELKFSSLTFDDSGMYQCVAENYWGIKYANAQLQVIGKSGRFKRFQKQEVSQKHPLFGCSVATLSNHLQETAT